MTFAALAELYGTGEVITSPIGWSSDISAIIQAGFQPVFCDVTLANLGLNIDQAISAITDHTKAILLTHVLGYNAMRQDLLEVCRAKGIALIEDVCESHGATYRGRKCGTFGTVSNFSFYYAHHMSTIEGGMICTDNEELYRTMRMYRSHGMLRECGDTGYSESVAKQYTELYPEFIFMVPGYNMRSTELNAVIGLSQLKRLDSNIRTRRENYQLFIDHLDQNKYYTDFDNDGNSNYAFVILQRDESRYERIIAALRGENVEFRRGTAGGGNLLRQPFLRKRLAGIDLGKYPNAEYIHRFGIYTGNYPGLSREKILGLCELLNSV